MSLAAIQIGSVCLTAAEVIAQFAPVPWLAPAVSALNTLITMIDRAHANKNALGQLRERSIGFLTIIREKGKAVPAPEQQKLVTEAMSTLQNVTSVVTTWCSKNRIQLFIEQRALMDAVQGCNDRINGCLERLHLTVALSTVIWQSDLTDRAERDRRESMAYFSNITNQLAIIQMALQLPGNGRTAVMEEMQMMLPSSSTQDGQGLGKNLYSLQKSMQELLPNMHLKHGEIQRVGEPVFRTPFVDIWEGLYLNEEKVAIKMLRTVRATPRSLERLEREVGIWKTVWDADHGSHILPLYGFCQDDGNFPYVISPWPENGMANEYVMRVPQVDHLALIRGICAGICVLHTMAPPIVHGELRASNVVIDGHGNPLLSNFGFSRIMNDLSGVAISHTVGQDFVRWMAPELSSEDGKLSTSADIYAFGMTVLELMTHAKPWATLPSSHQVIPKVLRGERPPRPSDEDTVARGLDDRLWEIMQSCWEQSEIHRPSAMELLRRLNGEESQPGVTSEPLRGLEGEGALPRRSLFSGMVNFFRRRH